MSGLKPPEMSVFYRRLQSRGLTTTTLAEQLGLSRPALCRVLNGSRRRGPIWVKVQRLLTADECQLLDVAHRHPWNRKRLLRRPKWARVEQMFEGETAAAASGPANNSDVGPAGVGGHETGEITR